MPENIKRVRRRIRIVKNTRQLTRAMEMVSAAKLRRTSLLFEGSKPYTQKMKELIGRVISDDMLGKHAYFQVRPLQNILLIVFTADKGLCGSFNNNIISKTEAFIRGLNNSVDVDLFLIGKKGNDYFKRRKYNICQTIVTLSGRPDHKVAGSVADYAVNGFMNKRYDQVCVISARYISKIANSPMVETILPLRRDLLIDTSDSNSSTEMSTDYIVEPNADEVFDNLLPRFIRSYIYSAMVETFTCEHSARMIAMSNATRNCKDLLDSLTLKMNKARQSSITSDLLDIVGGAEALSNQ